MVHNQKREAFARVSDNIIYLFLWELDAKGEGRSKNPVH